MDKRTIFSCFYPEAEVQKDYAHHFVRIDCQAWQNHNPRLQLPVFTPLDNPTVTVVGKSLLSLTAHTHL